MTRIVFRQEAAEDVRKIIAWYEETAPEAVANVLAESSAYSVSRTVNADHRTRFTKIPPSRFSVAKLGSDSIRSDRREKP